MAIGIAASDSELALAYFRQACYDLKNGKRMIDLELDGGKALAVAQFQQCCEKALKAIMLLEAGRVLYGQTVKPSHRIWSADLKDGRLTQVRRQVEKVLIPKSERRVRFDMYLLKIENYAPRMSWRHENTEYPWVDSAGLVISPAEYFEERENEILDFAYISRSLLKQIKVFYNPRFNDVWLTVEQIES